jgi:hypothetical protein
MPGTINENLRPKRSAISWQFHRLELNAQSTGQDQRVILAGGARMTLRVAGDVRALTIARPDKPIGDVEETTFRRDCFVPDGATRIPGDGQNTRQLEGVTYHTITFVWNDKTGEPAELPRTKE